MTKLISRPVAGLKGAARVPGDKSISHRALMLGAIASGETTVTGLLEGEDVLRTARALLSMGAIVTPPAQSGGTWSVQGPKPEGGRPPALRSPRAMLDLGNSGTSARLLMGLVSGYPASAIFTGDASLTKRPMGRVIKPLSQMGARFEATAGDRLPLKVMGSGNLRGISYTLPVPSAQVKSAIILAGLHAAGETAVTEPSPTRDHSERMLRHFGASVESHPQKDGSNLVLIRGGAVLEGRPISVPSDPSSAAFLAVAALITRDSDIVIPNVSVNPLRTGLYDTLKEMGADITFENPRERAGEPVCDLRVKSSRLKGVTVPPARVPAMIDEFPILSVAASFAEGKTVMTDLAELRVKESDRLAAIVKGLSAAGVKLVSGEDSLAVEGDGKPPRGGCAIETRLDHRIAMSFLVLGMGASEAVTIDDSDTMNTSFPGFAALVNGLGADISAIQ
jgi:3-phosphoshikimate 1-carboxyvinyltransferase